MLYGNHALRHCLTKMTQGSRLAQCLLFYGEKGLGKKTFAKWFAMSLLCTENNGNPCGSCKSCKSVLKNIHPDVMWVPHSGKLGGFSVETVRSVCSDAIVAPNSGNRKVYIFDDCDKMDPRAQNILLKIIEEPPAFAYFIFTAASRQALLPTVISRLMPFGVCHCTREETLSALSERGYCQEDAKEAADAFCGNIGQCIDYMENEDTKSLVSLTKTAVRCIIDKREYDLLKCFYSVGTDRNKAYALLHSLEKIFRDASALRLDTSLPCTGCDYNGALALAEKLSAVKGQHYHNCITKAYTAAAANVNVQLILSALCAELTEGR